MEEIIKVLRTDETLKVLTGGMIKPFGQLPLGKGLTYEFSTAADNGIVAIDRLTLTAVSWSIDESNAILDRAKRLLLTIGDTPFSQSIKKIEQNGGGSMTNYVDGKTMYHFTAIFNITRRD